MRLPHLAVVLNWRNEANKSGLYPVHIRIKIGEDAKYYKVEVPKKILRDQWSGEEDRWVKNTHEFAFEINNKIREKKNIILDLIKRSYSFNKNLTFETIFLHLTRKGEKNSFYDYMDGYIKKPPELLADNTLKKYTTCLHHLKHFRKKTLYFSDIDKELIRDFHRHMQTKLHLQGAACKKYMEAFKKVIRQARKENYIDPAQMEFLFEDVKISVPKPKRTFLDPKEIIAWKSLIFCENQKHLERDRDLFLFQVYTGYYYKDLFAFSKDQLIEDEQYGFFIAGARDKNGNQTLVPLFKFPYAAQIIREYQSSAPDRFVFDRKNFVEEPVYNRNLKDIAGLANISKNVSNKVGRHTNAQLWVRFGAETAILSKMLGHKKQETTKNYYDIDIIEIVEGTKKANFKKLGI